MKYILKIFLSLTVTFIGFAMAYFAFPMRAAFIISVWEWFAYVYGGIAIAGFGFTWFCNILDGKDKTVAKQIAEEVKVYPLYAKIVKDRKGKTFDVEYRFDLYARNHEHIVSSSYYATLDGCLTGLFYLIESLQGVDPTKFEVKH